MATLAFAQDPQVFPDDQEIVPAESNSASSDEKEAPQEGNLDQTLQEVPVMSEEKSRQISEYFEEALRNYEDILGQERSSEVRTTERRIENNIELLKQHRQNLGASETELRKIRLEYMERYLLLKNSFEKGKLDKKTYQKQLEQLAQDYRFKMSALVSDRDFYQGEAKKTEERLQELEEFNRINKIVLSQEGVAMPQEQQPPNEFEKIIWDIRKLGCFEFKNFCKSPDIH